MRTREPRTLRAPLAAAASLLLAASASAENVTERDRFKLWNDCRPVDLAVENVPTEAAGIGLTREAVAAVARGRLRAARLYDAAAIRYLYVSVNVRGPAHSISLQFNKVLYDSVSGEVGVGTTWQAGSVGIHGESADFALSAVARRMDSFIDEYLRVNADACMRR